MIPLIISPLRIAAAVGIAGLIGFGAGWQVNGWRKNVEIADIKAEVSQAALKFEAEARAKEHALSKQLEEARNAATKRETTLRRDADHARKSANSLRDDLAELRRTLPGLAADACRDRADTLAVILNECQGNYRGMAETADRLASDRQTLMDAWPK